MLLSPYWKIDLLMENLDSKFEVGIYPAPQSPHPKKLKK